MKTSQSLNRGLYATALLMVSVLLGACQTVPQGALNPPAQGAGIRVSGEAIGGSGTRNVYQGQGQTMRFTASDGAFALSAPASHRRIGNIAQAFSAPTATEQPNPAPRVSASTQDQLDGNITVPNTTPCNVEMSSRVQVALENDGTASLRQRMTLGPPTLLGQSHEAHYTFRVKSGDPTKIEVRKNSNRHGEFANGGIFDARDVETCTLFGADIVVFKIDTSAEVPLGPQSGLAIIAADTFYNITRRNP